jgi:hypothetical protein
MRGLSMIAAIALLALGGCETLGISDATDYVGNTIQGTEAPAARPVRPKARELAPPLPVVPPPISQMATPKPPAAQTTGPIILVPAQPAQPAQPEATTAPAAPTATTGDFSPCRLRGEIMMAAAADCTRMGGVPLR